VFKRHVMETCKNIVANDAWDRGVVGWGVGGWRGGGGGGGGWGGVEGGGGEMHCWIPWSELFYTLGA